MTSRSAIRFVVALASLVASAAAAQTEDLVFETSEGSFSIRLYDHPSVTNHPELVEHIAAFRRHYPTGSHSFFHLSESRECDDSICFWCVCGDDLFCQDDPDAHSCEPAGAAYWIVHQGESLSSPVLFTGRFQVDERNHIETIPDWMSDMTIDFQLQRGIWENRPLTVAFVRDQQDQKLTGEWVINLSEDANRFDFGSEENAYLVIGRVIDDASVLEAIAANRIHDASEDPAVVDDLGELVAAELEQVPVVDSFDADQDLFIEPCDPDVEPLCEMPLCEQPSEDGQSCESPRCLALVELSPEEQALLDSGQAVPRHCTEPVLPSFPLMVPEPGGLALQGSALLALAVLAAARRSSRRCSRKATGSR